MTRLQELLVKAAANKDFGEHAYFGAAIASKRMHKRYLRKNHLGKFSKGK